MAPPYGEPDWASPVEASAATTTDAGLTPNAAAVTSNNTYSAPRSAQSAKVYVYGLSILNLALSCLMGALGVLALLEFSPSLKAFTDTLLAIYLIIFASLLFGYEMIWWQPLPNLNKTFRKNFGFLYGLTGKGFYLIFTALLTIGFIREGSDTTSVVPSLDWITGIAWLAAGALHLFVSCTMPEVRDAYVPPKTGFEEEADDDYHNPV